ncbi:putative P-type phospholipid transporter [Helianthus anomalus]
MGKDKRKKMHLSKMYSIRRNGFEEDLSQIGGKGFSRVVHCNENGGLEGINLQNYADNYVRSTKYTPVTFLPKSLFEQFRRVANFYFLVTGILAFTPLAPYSAVSAILPLIVVIGATMVKEGIEDWQRQQQFFFVLLLVLVFESLDRKMFKTLIWVVLVSTRPVSEPNIHELFVNLFGGKFVYVRLFSKRTNMNRRFVLSFMFVNIRLLYGFCVSSQCG